MPGIFGVILKRSDRIDQAALLSMGRRMAEAMRSVPWLRVDLWAAGPYCGGRVHLAVLNPAPQPLVSADRERFAWFEGHYFPSPHTSQHMTPTAEEVFGFLNDPPSHAGGVDGVFTMACFDAARQVLLVGSDRLGFRPLYYAETADWFAYAAEVKALLAIHDRLPAIDQVGLGQFFSTGWMLDRRTWWHGISLMSPATIWRVSPQGTSHRRYWSADDLPANGMTLAKAREEFARLWALEVRRHSRPGGMTIPLSGGLDSRLLLAELANQGVDVVAATFGMETSDLARAREAARIAGVPHRACLLDVDNWWHRREEAVWYTDGLVNASYLSSSILMDTMHAGSWYSAVNIAGDLIFGGSRLASPHRPTDWSPETARRWLSQRYTPNPFVNSEEFVTSAFDEAVQWRYGPSADFVYLHTEYRRRALNFPIGLMAHCEFGFPGLGQETLSLFLHGIPESARRGSAFYNDFLAARYRRYYLNIPWEQSGRGLIETAPVKAWRSARSQVRRALRRMGRRVGRRLPQEVKARGRALVAETEAERMRGAAGWLIDFQAVYATRVRERLLEQELVVDEVLNGAARRTLLKNDPGVLGPRLLIGVLTAETYLRQALGMPWTGRAPTDGAAHADRVLPGRSLVG